MTITMFDSITISEIPSNPQAVAGYVGGRFPTFSQLVAAFPNAQHLSVAVNASEDADCLDIENGDAIPSEAPAWVKRQQARGVGQPCVYANTSTMPSVIAALTAANVSRDRYRVWTAHFTGVPHIEPGSDATQWTNQALGRNLDLSLCTDVFFTAAPAPRPPVVNAQHYDWFPTGPFPWGPLKLNERLVVERYDGARQHSVKYAAYLLFLRRELQFLANRVAAIAINQEPNKDGTASWGVDHRGWRFQQLVHRAQGQRFV